MLANDGKESGGSTGGEGFLAPFAGSLCLGRHHGLHQGIAYRRSLARARELGGSRVHDSYTPPAVFVDPHPSCLLGFLAAYIPDFLPAYLVLLGGIRYLLLGDTAVSDTPGSLGDTAVSGSYWNALHGARAAGNGSSRITRLGSSSVHLGT